MCVCSYTCIYVYMYTCICKCLVVTAIWIIYVMRKCYAKNSILTQTKYVDKCSMCYVKLYAMYVSGIVK